MSYGKVERSDAERISAISGIAVSPKRFHCTLYCQLYEDNIQGEEVAAFLRHLLRQVQGHLIVLLDNGKIHRGDPVQELLARTSRLHLAPFSPYAPELNPDEGVWNHLKSTLANGRPDTQAELMDVLSDEICCLAASQPFLRGCIQQSALPPFYPDCCIIYAESYSAPGKVWRIQLVENRANGYRVEIVWRRRETRRLTEKTKLNLRYWEKPVYSTHI